MKNLNKAHSRFLFTPASSQFSRVIEEFICQNPRAPPPLRAHPHKNGVCQNSKGILQRGLKQIETLEIMRAPVPSLENDLFLFVLHNSEFGLNNFLLILECRVVFDIRDKAPQE